MSCARLILEEGRVLTNRPAIRRTAVSTGASVEALRNFGNIPVTTGLAAAAPAFIEIPIHIESRIARVGYGYRCGTEPGDDITWFIQKV